MELLDGDGGSDPAADRSEGDLDPAELILGRAQVQNETIPVDSDSATGMAQSPLFSNFSPEELRAVISGLQLKTFAPGEIIVAEGEPGDSLFVVSEGIVRVYVRTAMNGQAEIRQMSDGAFFGEISVLTGGTRTATITAASPCELLELDRESLRSICAAQPGVVSVLRRFYQERHESLEEAVMRHLSH